MSRSQNAKQAFFFVRDLLIVRAGLLTVRVAGGVGGLSAGAGRFRSGPGRRIVVKYLPHVAAGVAVLAGVIMPGRQPWAEADVTAGTAVVRIMPFGDSITVGTGSPGRNGYRIDLQERLTSAGLAFDFVGSQKTVPPRTKPIPPPMDVDQVAAPSPPTGGRAPQPAGRASQPPARTESALAATADVVRDLDHEGHGGWTIDQMIAATDAWVAAARPHVILLHAGTNDITISRNPAATAAKLSRLIDRIRVRAPRAVVFVSTIVGTGVPAEIAANRAYNRLIPGVVAGKDADVHLVDQAAVAGLDLYDIHHPNGFGYTKMAYAWYQALRTTLYPDWPATLDPSAAERKYLCRHLAVRVCGWWYLRTVTTTTGGTEKLWQIRRPATESYPARVAGRALTRTRQVNAWSTTWN
jgi:lysophospholipase L1-like esterase